MKRITISFHQFLKDLSSGSDLGVAEASQIDHLLRDPDAPGSSLRLRDLIARLSDQGRLAIVEHTSEAREETYLLRDPFRRVRFRVRLPRESGRLEPEQIPLPLDVTTQQGLRYTQVQDLLAVEGNLIAYDRVMSPRELTVRLQQLLQDLLPASEVEFHALDMPASAAWPGIDWNSLPAEREELENLARERTHLLHWTESSDGSSWLMIGMGDSGAGWTGWVSMRSHEPRYFDGDRIALAVLVAKHFANLLSTLMRLEGLIFYDFLTGIYNRSFYEEQVDRELQLARRREQSMAVLIVDIDDFKAFNTRFGYDGGDRALATVACVLKAALRGTDTLARYGGEEFAIILAPPVPRDEAVRIAERLRSAVADEHFALTDLAGNRVEQQITVSIGGVLYPDGGSSPRELWARANRLVLEAKASGKNQVRFAPVSSENSILDGSLPD